MALMDRARQKANGLDELALLIAGQIGKKPLTRSAVSKYTQGTAMPPAIVFLAAMKTTEISVDESLFGESLSARQDRLEDELARLRDLVEKGRRR